MTAQNLKSTIQRHEKFKLALKQYTSFKQRLAEQMAESDEGVARSQADLRFTREFVQNLADDGVLIKADRRELAMLISDL